MHNPDSVLEKSGTGAPEKESEITPEMIEAGVGAYCRSNEDFESKESIVANIFGAMLNARPLPLDVSLDCRT